MQTNIFIESLQIALGPQFPIQRELGGGGMSRVFVARDVQLGRDVVVKVLAPELAQELSVERFAREISLAAALQHANIVPLLAAGATADGLPYYLMPFVDGESLRHAVDTRGPLPITDVQQVLQDVLRALAWAHARGVVHRDIKPDNVMRAGGAALVTDFGIAKAVSSARDAAHENPGDSNLTRLGTSLGTPNYMAPEQGTGDPSTDHRADIYALGAMTYELLTGAPPFGHRPAHAQLVAHLAETPVHVRERRPDTPDALASLVMLCLEKDPGARPQSAPALLELLSQTGASASITATHATTTNAQPHITQTLTARSGRGWIAVAALVLVTSGVGAYWYATTRSSPPVADDTLLAVMPFTVRDAPLQVWREGLVDVLSRSLDGAGNLRIASPSSSIAGSPERADATSAGALAASLGAGLVLFGDLGAVGPDSVHLRAALYDVALGRTRADFDVQGEASRLDALADTLALRVLRELGASGTLSGGRLSSIGTSSLPALKAFVEGQRLYRSGRVDSARTAFQNAVAADSTFSLAWRGIAATLIRVGREREPEAQQALEQAIRFKSGRSPRDSMLLLADSLRLAFSRRTAMASDAVAELPSLTPLFATLREATRRYPDDAELWMELGDAGFHFGEFAAPPVQSSLSDFERAIALDSSLLVPLLHAYDLALRIGDAPRAAKYVARLGALSDGQAATYYELLAAALDSSPRLSRKAQQMLDTLPVVFTLTAMQALAPMADTLAIVDRLVARELEKPTATNGASEAEARESVIAYAFGIRGRYREMLARNAQFNISTRAQLAALAVLPAAEVRAEVERALRRDASVVVPAIPFLTSERDTVLLSALVDSLSARVTREAGTTTSVAATTSLTLARSGLQLARADSSAALATLLSLPMTSCNAPCSGQQLAELLVAAGRDADAARVLDRWLPLANPTFVYPKALLLRAQIAERLDDQRRAIEAYRGVVARWSGGDEAVRGTVDSAREGLRRLAAER